MGEFKSFDEFQRELHGLPDEKAPANDSPLEKTISSEPKKKSFRKKHWSFRRRKKRNQGKQPDVMEDRGTVESSDFVEEPVHKRQFVFKFKHFFMGIAAVIVIIFVSLMIFPLPFGEIRISGTKEITMNDVIFEGKLKQPTNVLQISASNLQQRLSHDIRISNVTVKRAFPWYIDVDITDRKPLAVVQGDYVYAVLDQSGFVMETETSLKGVDLPLITGKKAGNVLLGDTITDPSIQKALLFISSLTPDGFKAFSEVNVGQDNNIIAYTREGIAVHLGNGDKMKEQAPLAENMVGDVKARGLNVEYIDVNVSSPFIKLKK